MRIVHFADTHLGMTNFGSLDAATGLHDRVLDFLDAIDIIVTQVGRLKPDLIVFSGDGYRTRNPSQTLSVHYGKRIQAMANVAPVVAVVGNHDRQKSGVEKKHAITAWSMLQAKHPIYVLKDIAVVEFSHSYVVTLPWFYASNPKPYIQQILQAYDTIDDNLPIILVAHCDADGAQYNEQKVVDIVDDQYVYPADLFTLFDYCALGHIHGQQQVYPNTWYSGSVERVDWGERKGDKGFLVIDLDNDGQLVNVQKVSTQPRPMKDIAVRYKHIQDLVDASVDDAVVRVTVDCDKLVSEAAVNKAVKRWLNGGYYYLDNVIVNVPRQGARVRDEWKEFAGTDQTLLDELDTLEMYLIAQGVPDKRIDKLFTAALKLKEKIGDG